MTTQQQKVHFIGIAGAGMSAVATIMRDAGWHVSGSDAGVYDPIKSYLDDQGFTYHVGHVASNIPTDVDIIIIGKHVKLVPESNQEVAEAFKRKDEGKTKIMSLPEALEMIAHDTQQVVICGSYGKSTCTALTSFLLAANDKQPSYYIGALPLNFDQHGKKDSGNVFVLEGDEYPTSNWDNQSKFLWYNPKAILMTSGEHDHVNVFPTEEDYIAPYHKLTQKQSVEVIVGCYDNPNVLSTLHVSHARTTTYSLENQDADWYATNITYGQVSTFDLTHQGEYVGQISTQLLGKHNLQNIVGVVALLLENNLLTFNEIAQTLPDFLGVRRRLDRVSADSADIPVYEGFGSSLSKARSAIEALLLHFPERQVNVVFEPHTFSWRNQEALGWYDQVFNGVTGNILLYKPPVTGSASHAQLTLDEIMHRVNQSHQQATGYSDFDLLLSDLSTTLQAQSHPLVLILTSGSFDGRLQEITATTHI